MGEDPIVNVAMARPADLPRSRRAQWLPRPSSFTTLSGEFIHRLQIHTVLARALPQGSFGLGKWDRHLHRYSWLSRRY
jgi:hypothetical protein